MPNTERDERALVERLESRARGPWDAYLSQDAALDFEAAAAITSLSQEVERLTKERLEYRDQAISFRDQLVGAHGAAERRLAEVRAETLSKVAETTKVLADGYRRENLPAYTAEQVACGVSNAGYFALISLGFSHAEICGAASAIRQSGDSNVG